MSTVDPGGVERHRSAPLNERRLFDALSDAVIVADDANLIVSANRATERLLGWTSDALVGQPLTTIIPARLRAAHLEGFSRFVMTGETRILGTPVRVPALRSDGAEAPIELTLAEFDDDGQRRVVGVLRDASSSVELERQVAMTEYFRATTEVAILLGLSGRAHSLDDAAPLVLAAVGRSLHWQVGSLWLVDKRDDLIRCTHRWQSDEMASAGFDDPEHPMTFEKGEGIAGAAWASGEPVWVADFPGGGYRRSNWARQHDLHSAFAFPITAGSEVIGVMEFFMHAAHDPDPDLVGVVATIGHQIGQFIERSWAEVELMASRERFAELARTLQATLRPPELPDISGLELGARYHPAGEGAEVGGDFYDLFPTRGTTWAMVIGDVCGRGAQAATQTAVARYTLRTASLQARRPSRMLTMLNEVVHRGGVNEHFLTAAVMTVRPREGRMTLALGGHPQPVLLSAAGTATLVGKPGMLVGVTERADVSDTVLTLEPGEALVLYTDGVTEARRTGEQLGTDRLLTIIEGAAGLHADEIAGHVLRAVQDFQGGDGDDDVAILVLRRRPA